MTFWLVRSDDGIEPELCGPYATEGDRDEAAKNIRREQDDEGNDQGTIWPLDIDDDNLPVIGTYSGGFFTNELQE